MTWKKTYKESKHKCDKLPPIDFSTPVGTVIECDGCGKQYIAKSISQHGESWSQWERNHRKGTV